MSAVERVPKWVGTTFVCILIGLVSYYGTGWALQTGVIGWGEADEVVFDETVLDEANQYLADLRAAKQLVDARWSYLEYRTQIDGVDLEQRLRDAENLLGTEPSNRDFCRALAYFVAGLRDGHAFSLPTQWEPLHPYRLPCSLVEVAEGIMVDASHSEQLTRGDLIESINGESIEAWIERATQFVFASSESGRRFAAIEFVASSMLDVESVQAVVLRTDGSRATISLACPPSFTRIDTPSRPATERTHKMLSESVAYFRPGKFTAPEDSGWSEAPPDKRNDILAESFAEIDSIIANFAEASRLILDPRGNPGGTDLLGQFLVDRLIEPGYTYYRLSSLGRSGWRDYSGHASSAPAGESKMRTPLVVLVGPLTFSTADNVAACLEDNHPDVRFVGRENGAGTGAPRGFELPRTGSKIYFCTQRVKTASGRFGEGIPVEIDLEVLPTRADLLNGRDAVLEQALTLL